MNKKPLILVVEDEDLILKALRRKLDENGFETALAKDGKEGLDIALDKHPDLILLDIVLPVMDGMSFLDELRKDEWGGKVPVIVLTNLSRASAKKESEEKGVRTYLLKTDWKLDEVVKKIKNELGIV